jgi:hypothetical protein
MAGGGRRRLFFHGELFLLVISILWISINFYLVDNLTRYESPPPILSGQVNGIDGIDKKPNGKPSKVSHTYYTFDRELAEASLAQHGHEVLFQPLRAYIEKKLNDTVPNTIDKGNLDEQRPKLEVGRPAKFYVPLPLREGSPEDVSRLLSRVCIAHIITLTMYHVVFHCA